MLFYTSIMTSFELGHFVICHNGMACVEVFAIPDYRASSAQGSHWSGKSQGNLFFLQGQGIL